jgi:hypothetical protein
MSASKAKAIEPSSKPGKVEAPGGAIDSRFGGGGGGSQLPLVEDGGMVPGAGFKLGGGDESGRAPASAAAPVPFDGGGGAERAGAADGVDAGAGEGDLGAIAGSSSSSAFGVSLTNFIVARATGAPLGRIGGGGAAGETAATGATGTAGADGGAGGATAPMPRGNVPRRDGSGGGFRGSGSLGWDPGGLGGAPSCAPGCDSGAERCEMGSDDEGTGGTIFTPPPGDEGDAWSSGRTAGMRVESMRTAAIWVEPSVDSE